MKRYIFKRDKLHVPNEFTLFLGQLKKHNCNYSLSEMVTTKKNEYRLSLVKINKYLKNRGIILMENSISIEQLNYQFCYDIHIRSHPGEVKEIKYQLKKEYLSLSRLFYLLFSIVEKLDLVYYSYRFRLDNKNIGSDLKSIFETFMQLTFIYDLMILTYISSINDHYIEKFMLNMRKNIVERDSLVTSLYAQIRAFGVKYKNFTKNMQDFEKQLTAMLLIREFLLVRFSYLDRRSAFVNQKYSENYKHNSYVDWVKFITTQNK